MVGAWASNREGHQILRVSRSNLAAHPDPNANRLHSLSNPHDQNQADGLPGPFNRGVLVAEAKNGQNTVSSVHEYAPVESLLERDGLDRLQQDVRIDQNAMRLGMGWRNAQKN